MFGDFKTDLKPQHVVIAVVVLLALMLVIIYGVQHFIDPELSPKSKVLTEQKEQYEITKLEAEISRIRSDTAGSLFWLKLIALFVTVGGAVGGYLFGLTHTTKSRERFENRKNVDQVYQSIVQELADDSPVLRAAAVVKLGSILSSFPAEWIVTGKREEQIIALTKQVLAASLSIEQEPKVLKTITISLALHKPASDGKVANMADLDMSGAVAEDAYWANCNLKYADFFKAKLAGTSFRGSDLSVTQFRQAELIDVVFDEAVCKETNFKMADLKGASFKMADLRGASFNGTALEAVNLEDAKVYGVSLHDAKPDKIKSCRVDVSENGDGTKMIDVHQWIENGQTASAG